ncbi:MAG: peptidoglycan editing factor PgeF [Clostridia bacterium]|nr:peptidoglycan editing factor PgeF [Clostridia bacterium]
MKDLSNENVIHIVKDGIQYLQFRKLLEYEHIITHAYSLGIDANFRTAKPDKQKISKEEYEKSAKSYKNICEKLNINYLDVVKTNQEHTNNVQIVNGKINQNDMDVNLDKYNNTDGLITNKTNLALSTTNADCILMIFFDPATRTIANIHSGWRGTLQRISIKAVEKMIKEFNCNPKDIICCICPSIRKCHFEVDKDVKEMFEKEFADFQINKRTDIIEKQEGKEKWNIDTVLINKIILENLGLKKENIIDSGICSVCNSDLIHSYRVEKQGYGLGTALISIK